MASKVNTKFVVGLAVGAMVVAGAVVMAYVKLVKNTPERLVAAGDAQLKIAEQKKAAGDATGTEEAVAQAIVFYSKAVNKEQTNVSLLKKWDEAMRMYAPATRVVYEKTYLNDFMMIRRQLAILEKTSVESHRLYLEVLYKQTNDATQNPDLVIRATNEMLKYFDEATDPAEKAKRSGILRYRGIGLLRQAVRAEETKPEVFESAREDLAAALAYDPKDEEAAESLMAINYLESERAANAVRPEEAATAKARALEVGRAFLASNPENPRIVLAMARAELVERVRSLNRNATRAEQLAEQTAARSALKPALDRAAAAMEASDLKALDPSLLQVLAQLELSIDPASRLSRTMAIAKRVGEAQPNEAEALLNIADISSRVGQFDDAIGAAQKIGELPVKPISLDGIQLYGLKRAAAGQAAGWAMDIVETTEDVATKKAALERAKVLRDVFAGYAEATDPTLKFVNGRIALAEGRVGEASRLIKEYNDATQDGDTRGMLYASIAAVSQMNPDTGYAKERLMRVLAVEPGNVMALLQMARIEIVNQNASAAEQALRAVLEISPDNPVALDMIKAIRGEGMAETDPAAADLMAAMKAVPEGDGQAMIAAVRGVLEKHPDDPRVSGTLARQMVATGDRAGALAVVEAGLVKKPGDTNLKLLKTVLSSTNDLQAEIDIIKQIGGKPEVVMMRCYAAYRAAGKTTEALAELEAAEKIAPEAPAVVESRFLWALENQQWEIAGKKMELAVSKNMDNADGLTFKARLQEARGQTADAVTSVDQALDKVPANTEMFRLKGRLLARLGRVEEAIAAFRSAYEARPTDAAANREYVAALISVNRLQEALEHCRRNERIANSDAEFASVWMGLEAQMGDRKKALTTRELMHRIYPERRENTLSLAQMYVQDARYDDAKKLTDEVRASGDGMDVAGVEAMSLDSQKKIDEAKAVYRRLAESSDRMLSLQGSMLLAEYTLARGDGDGAVKALEDARPKQDAKVAEVDRAMMMLFERMGQTDRQIESARRVVAASGDEDGAIRKQIIRTFLRSGKFDDADKEYAGLVPLENKDPEVLLLKADTKMARGDSAGARFILDDAAARFPENTLVYNVRALYFLNVAKMFRESVTDLTKSLSLNPIQPRVLATRARAYVALQQSDLALADIEALAIMMPGDSVARGTWISNLLDMKQTDRAIAAGEKLVQLNNGSAAVCSEIAGIFGGQYQLWEQASRFYRVAYESVRTPDAAAELVVSYMRHQPPRLAEAGQIITEISDKSSEHWPMLLATARWQGAQLDKAGARASLTKALTLMSDDNLERLRFWDSVAGEVITDRAELLAYLDQLERTGVKAQYTRWFRGTAMCSDPSTFAQGMEILGAYADPQVPEALRLTNFRQVSGILLSRGMIQEGYAFCQKGLEQFPKDPELLNNAAYTLAKDLGKPEEALPLAELAVTVAGNSADAYDTLGFIQMALKKYPEARRSLETSYSMANNSNNYRAIVISLVHLGQLFVDMSDKEAARLRLGEAQNWARQVPSLGQEFEKELLDLASKVE